MKLLILGYGKMGKEIEAVALERGHQIAHKIDKDNYDQLQHISNKDVDAAIEFSQPDAAENNYYFCLDRQIPVVTGTTGWLDKKPAIESYCAEKNGTFFYAPNFSIGVNIFFKLNEYLAGIMEKYGEYDPVIDETHHKEKKDAPSGTAIHLANGITNNLTRKSKWVKGEEEGNGRNLVVNSYREDNVPGTHVVSYHSTIDDIVIQHTAHSRKGFALGAVLVAEWIRDKKGVLTMDDFLNIQS